MNKRTPTARRLAWALAVASAIIFIFGVIRVSSMEIIEWRIYPEFFIVTTLAVFSIMLFRYDS